MLLAILILVVNSPEFKDGMSKMAKTFAVTNVYETTLDTAEIKGDKTAFLQGKLTYVVKQHYFVNNPDYVFIKAEPMDCIQEDAYTIVKQRIHFRDKRLKDRTYVTEYVMTQFGYDLRNFTINPKDTITLYKN
ncbi:MAG: hypothetical protein SNJ71_04645 [Bacteroidales bacterium]